MICISMISEVAISDFYFAVPSVNVNHLLLICILGVSTAKLCHFSVKVHREITQYIIFSTERTRTHVYDIESIAGSKIQGINYHKFLGIVIDKTISWHEHIVMPN